MIETALAAAAWMVVQTVAYGGATQSAVAFRYGSMSECWRAVQKVEVRPRNDGGAELAAPPYCTNVKPAWWIDR